MRPGADAGVVAVAPVGEVVPALLARPGVVADLVGRQAGLAQQLLGQLVEGGLVVIVHRRHGAGADQGVKARAGLDRELVDREVAVRHPEPRPQLGRPRGRGLPRPGVDQVERVPREQAGSELDSGPRLGRAVLPPEEAQAGVIQRLDAERDAVHARLAERAQPAGLDRGRVRLERDLDVRLSAPAAAPRARSRRAAVPGSISEGVPPPKKIEVSRRPAVSAATRSSSARSARRQRP